MQASTQHMKNSHLIIDPRPTSPAHPTTRATERPIKVHIVFDDDASARRAEVLITHVTCQFECDMRSFAFDDLDLPGPGIAAARSASDADILMVSVRDDEDLPRHMKAWLDLYLGLRDKDQEGALVLLIAKAATTADPDSSLVEYLESVAAIGGLSFIPNRRSPSHNSASDHPSVARQRVPWLGNTHVRFNQTFNQAT